MKNETNAANPTFDTFPAIAAPSLAGCLLALSLASACGGEMPGSGSPAPPEQTASVFFIRPLDGEIVPHRIELEMAARGLFIGPVIADPGAGPSYSEAHFNVLIDRGCIPPGELFPWDESHVSFPDGSTWGEIYLPPGRHTLCLQVGDSAFRALGPVDMISVWITE